MADYQRAISEIQNSKSLADIQSVIAAYSAQSAGLSQDVLAPDDVSSDRTDPRKRTDDTTSEEDTRQAHEPTYMAHVALAANGIRTENGFTQLEPGMAVTAEIKTGHRTVISYLLSSLSRFK